MQPVYNEWVSLQSTFIVFILISHYFNSDSHSNIIKLNIDIIIIYIIII